MTKNLRTFVACGLAASGLLVLLAICWSQAGQADETKVPAEKGQTQHVVFGQEFHWDAGGGSAQYTWGQDGFLKIDGSKGQIQCSRRFSQRITGGDMAIQVDALVALGREYHLNLYDSAGNKIIDTTIARIGDIRFESQGKPFDTTLSVAKSRDKEPMMGVASPLRSFGFGEFDFKAQTFTFELDGKKSPGMPMAGAGVDADRVELRTDLVEPGTLIWVERYQQLKRSGEVVEDERFDHSWICNAAVTPGYPADKWQTTTYRPVDFKWLEVATHYGAVYVRFSDEPIVRGTLEFDMAADNVDHETQVNLGEYAYSRRGDPGYLPADADGISTISGGWKGAVGLFAGVWTPYVDSIENTRPSLFRPYGTFAAFDNAPPAVPDQAYHVKMRWDADAKTYRVWIDGVLQLHHGKPDITMIHLPDKGIDTVMIHPGDRNPWHGPLLRSRWANFKVTSEE